MGETSLHAAIKEWYARPGDQLEFEVDGYVVDVVRGKTLIEIQTRNFSAIKNKLKDLTECHPVRLVYPVSQIKWIIRLDRDGERARSKRRSPKKGRVEDLFYELVYLPSLVMRPTFSLEVLLIHSEEVLIDDNRGSWRRRRWSIHDRHLLQVVDSRIFSTPQDFMDLLPESLPDYFTTKDLARSLKIRRSLAQKMAYCLQHMGKVKVSGKKGRWHLYTCNV